MTGFTRFDSSNDAASWTWEVRAVNGKGLDIRTRLPAGLEALEAPIKKQCGAALDRGNIQISLNVQASSTEPSQVVNQAALDNIIALIAVVDNAVSTKPSTAAEILSIRGVLETREPVQEESARAQFEQALLSSLSQTLDALNDHREEEGRALASFLTAHVEKMADLLAKAEADPSRHVDAIRERLRDQVEKLTNAHDGIDPARLHQEAALLATKADIREELDRLAAHVASAKDLIATGSPVGRKLEFLAQEFNREANTLCSKSNALAITEIGLAMKVIIDQFREQALNVE